MEQPTNTSDDRPSGKRARNNLKHGLRTVSLGSVPAGASYVGRLTMRLRREVENAVVASKGSVDLMDSCHINTAVKWERHSLLCTLWLRKQAPTMSHDQRLAYSRAIAKASECRDKALEKLGLDQGSVSIIDALYSMPNPPESFQDSTEDDSTTTEKTP